MASQSHFQCNVSQNGKHLFATAEHSATTAWEAKRIMEELIKRFPEKEGFSVSCTHWQCGGCDVQLEDL